MNVEFFGELGVGQKFRDGCTSNHTLWMVLGNSEPGDAVDLANGYVGLFGQDDLVWITEVKTRHKV